VKRPPLQFCLGVPQCSVIPGELRKPAIGRRRNRCIIIEEVLNLRTFFG